MEHFGWKYCLTARQQDGWEVDGHTVHIRSAVQLRPALQQSPPRNQAQFSFSFRAAALNNRRGWLKVSLGQVCWQVEGEGGGGVATDYQYANCMRGKSPTLSTDTNNAAPGNIMGTKLHAALQTTLLLH